MTVLQRNGSNVGRGHVADHDDRPSMADSSDAEIEDATDATDAATGKMSVIGW